MNETDPLIDAALDTYPLAPLPPHFSRRTMAAVRANDRPRFRLEFLDLALPAFFVLFTATMSGLSLWLFTTLNPLWLLDLRIRANWYLQNLDLFPIGWFAAAAIAGVFVAALAGLVLALAMDRPVRIVRA